MTDHQLPSGGVKAIGELLSNLTIEVRDENNKI